MATLKIAPATEMYCKARQAARDLGDNNFCFPLAISLLTDTPLATVTAMLAEEGRKHQKGTPGYAAIRVIDKLGYKLDRVHIRDIIDSYPKPHCNVLKNVTTHHPRRFPASFDKSKKYLAHCRGHVLAIIDGQVQDWSINNSLQIYKLEEVVRK